jgi:hypothetical protein
MSLMKSGSLSLPFWDSRFSMHFMPHPCWVKSISSTTIISANLNEFYLPAPPEEGEKLSWLLQILLTNLKMHKATVKTTELRDGTTIYWPLLALGLNHSLRLPFPESDWFQLINPEPLKRIALWCRDQNQKLRFYDGWSRHAMVKLNNSNCIMNGVRLQTEATNMLLRAQRLNQGLRYGI